MNVLELLDARLKESKAKKPQIFDDKLPDGWTKKSIVEAPEVLVKNLWIKEWNEKYPKHNLTRDKINRWGREMQ